MIAAAGVVALTEMVDRLAEDHANAKLLAQGLAKFDAIDIDVEKVQSNLVYFGIDEETMTADRLLPALAAHGVLVGGGGYGVMRAVTNYHVTASDIEHVLTAFEEVLP